MAKPTKLFTTPPVRIARTTDAAVKVLLDSDEYWIPFSQIREPDEAYIRGMEGVENEIELTIPEWMAKEKGMM